MENTLSTNSKSLIEIDLLKFFAIFLITNSHISHLYPNPNMGTGGGLGNSIFFLVSAIGLTFSLSKKKINFLPWFYKRASRTYLITWVATLLFLLLGYYKIELTVKDLVRTFIFPTGYWFIPAITLFYIPLYYIIIHYSLKLIIYVSAAVCIFYFAIYFSYIDIFSWSIEANSFFKWIFYCEVMIIGVCVSKNYNSIKYNGISDIIIFFLLTLFYFGFKLLTTKFNSLMPLQFILHLITIPWVIYLLKIMKSDSITALTSHSIINIIILTISAITLEIYLLQSFFYGLPLVKSLLFPINIILFFILLIMAAWCFHKVFHLIFFRKKNTVSNSTNSDK